jgi:hypothetical protein
MPFPTLCDCVKHCGFIEHSSADYTYVLWVLPDGAHIAFLHKDVLANGLTNKGSTLGELVLLKQSIEEPCKMISRPFLQTLGYKPDYVVVTDYRDENPTFITSGYTMHTILQLAARNPTMEHIRTLAEGPGEPCGPRNQLGQTLTSLSLRLSSKGFFADPKYFPNAARDMKCLSAGMSVGELRLRKLFKVI